MDYQIWRWMLKFIHIIIISILNPCRFFKATNIYKCFTHRNGYVRWFNAASLSISWYAIVINSCLLAVLVKKVQSIKCIWTVGSIVITLDSWDLRWLPRLLYWLSISIIRLNCHWDLVAIPDKMMESQEKKGLQYKYEIMCGNYDVYWSCVVKLYIINKATTLCIKQYIIMSFWDIHNTTIAGKAYRCIKMDCGCCNSGSKKKKEWEERIENTFTIGL